MMTETRAEKWLHEGADEYREKQKVEKLHTEFDTTDKASIKKLSDAELARWQAKYPSGSPQVIFAEQLWKYRLAKHSAKFTALIAIISAIVGGIVGYSLRGSQDEITKQKPQAEIHQNVNPTARQKVPKSPKVSVPNSQ